MSNEVFPILAGQKIEVTKEPIWSTLHAASASQMEASASYVSYPLYRITLAFEVLRATPTEAEYQSLLGFFNSRGGSLESFLWQDPDDNAVTDQAFGTGDGATTVFRLGRTLGGAYEPVSATSGTPVIKKAGVTQTVTTDYTLDANAGTVTFTTAPAVAAALTWSGSYLRRVRFESDSMSLKRFLEAMYSADNIRLITKKT